MHNGNDNLVQVDAPSFHNSKMPLIRRSTKAPSSGADLSNLMKGAYDGRKRKGIDPGMVLFLICASLAIGFAITMDMKTASKQSGGVKQHLDEGVILSLEMERENDNTVTLGPHKARVAITKKGCPKPRLWMRVVGDALVSIPLDPENDDKRRWSASFSFPLEGTYSLEARWYGCDETATAFKGLSDPIKFKVKGGDSEGQLLKSRSSEPQVFPVGFWASKRKFKNPAEINAPYVWFSEAQKGTLPSPTPKLKSATSLGTSTVAVEGNPISGGFGTLSNYELVCWVGSASSALVRDAFLSIRGQINQQQRPFKFHYYALDDFAQPDKDWEGQKGGFRKCKTVLISVDEIVGELSQSDYKKQVEHFINEVLTCLHDDTFPIWMFTVNAPPMVLSQMCHSPSKHTHNHPCNDALFDLFEKRNNFPPQVKLLDNTDLVDPHFDSGLKDIHAVIAMRIFALVANQVDQWRDTNQIGHKEGLMRNGTLEPNVLQEEYVFEPL
jgi:hypothetical protein